MDCAIEAPNRTLQQSVVRHSNISSISPRVLRQETWEIVRSRDRGACRASARRCASPRYELSITRRCKAFGFAEPIPARPRIFERAKVSAYQHHRRGYPLPIRFGGCTSTPGCGYVGSRRAVNGCATGRSHIIDNGRGNAMKIKPMIAMGALATGVGLLGLGVGAVANAEPSAGGSSSTTTTTTTPIAPPAHSPSSSSPSGGGSSSGGSGSGSSSIGG